MHGATPRNILIDWTCMCRQLLQSQGCSWPLGGRGRDHSFPNAHTHAPVKKSWIFIYILKTGDKGWPMAIAMHWVAEGGITAFQMLILMLLSKSHESCWVIRYFKDSARWPGGDQAQTILRQGGGRGDSTILQFELFWASPLPLKVKAWVLYWMCSTWWWWRWTIRSMTCPWTCWGSRWLRRRKARGSSMIKSWWKQNHTADQWWNPDGSRKTLISDQIPTDQRSNLDRIKTTLLISDQILMESGRHWIIKDCFSLTPPLMIQLLLLNLWGDSIHFWFWGQQQQ